MRRSFVLTLAAVALAAALIGVLVFSPAAEWFEAWRQRARVVAGAERFETVTITEQAVAPQTGEFDGEPGEDLAIVDYTGVRLLQPATLAEEHRFELGGDVGARWTPSSRLARSGGALVVVDTGGGLDETRVRDLDGTQRWRYRPDADVPPTSLAPADLDADGDAEFYATISSYAVRLDTAGQEVWRAPFSVGQIAATAPRTRRDPAWIVATGQGQTVVWDDSGMRLAAVTMKDARPLGVIDWSDGRYVLAGGSAARAITLDGRVVFDWAVPGLIVVQALPVLLEPGAPAAVALVATNPGEMDRWRFQIVSRDKTLIYDEILDAPTEILKARGPDGVERIFLHHAGLFALRRRG